MEFVNVPVPAEHVTHVYKLIAELDEARKCGDEAEEASSASPVDQGDWPVDELARFAVGTTSMHETISGMLDILAADPGAEIALSAMARKLGITRPILRGRLAALTRNLKAHFDFSKLGWPMQWVWKYDDAGSRETYYVMSPDQAQRWRSVRGS